jgi:Tol biopolymer transport system component
VNLSTGVEECILSDPEKSFSTPSLSPDGKWILCTGSTPVPAGKTTYWNTDVYVCRTDGTHLSQLTYHAADDLSPEWSHDGRYIYFISQRGSATATANVWRMSFVVF